MTAASFQARLTASCTPVFMPWPEAGLWTWAASPATKQRPERMVGIMRCWMVKTETQLGAATVAGRPVPASILAAKRLAIASSSPS